MHRAKEREKDGRHRELTSTRLSMRNNHVFVHEETTSLEELNEVC